MSLIPRQSVATVAALMALLVSACGAGAPQPGAAVSTPAGTPATAATAEATATGTPTAFVIVEASASPTPAAAVRPAGVPEAPLTTRTVPAAPSTTTPTPRTITLSGRGVPVVVLDPGHGGDESGAAAYGVVERDSNLDMAERTAKYLRAAGVDVVLTREDENRAAGPTSGEFSATRTDLQARVSLANAVNAAVFVSLHSNGSSDPAARGVEVYWESRQPWADKNLRLAQTLLDGVVNSLDAAGYPTRSRGTIDAACWRNRNGRCVGLFVLSPAGSTVERSSPGGGTGSSGALTTAKEATKMPAALVESLFVSNVEDAALLRSNDARDAIARGLSGAILRYLGL